ncbi:cytochrome b561 and DOMON domain-containing protein At3g25290 [Zea mays]|uniref:Cytochrome b561 and DOMON domain-containing protein n=2 Tax=Zea mays TaxID=4577 RepID=A0A1D6I7X0_MAIZE|nr:cytochrome b561 and DOMON domain-containing protein At3g25290 [Zea mays]ONM56142.1 Cytochrome b561 and DOMON domain-containing protein [Zea mays]|eukprot:XP_008652911.1 cytochrome b561 and DOMON domain-containing protein At3g25290 [Zea mays]
MAMATAGAVIAACILALLAPPPARAAGGGRCAGESFSANRAYAACNDLPRLGASMHWTYDRASGDLHVAFVAAPAAPGGWVAWALNPSGDGMAGAQALVAGPFPDGGGTWAVRTYNVSGYALGEPGPIAFPASDLAAELGADGRVRVFGTLGLGAAAVGGGGVLLNQVWQVGAAVSSGGVPAPHAMGADNLAAKAKLDLLRATTVAAGADSATRKRNIHGVLNAVSWGLLLPMGAIFARYLKTFRAADPAWFYLHVTCQLIGYGVGVSGWATGMKLGKESRGVTYTDHRNIGIAVFALGTLQVLALFLRPKKEHKFRVYWNTYHHSVGYAVIVLGVVNIFKGMSILGVEQRWRTAYIAAVCVLLVAAAALEAVTWGVVLRRRKADGKTFSSAPNGHLPHSVSV